MKHGDISETQLTAVLRNEDKAAAVIDFRFFFTFRNNSPGGTVPSSVNPVKDDCPDNMSYNW